MTLPITILNKTYRRLIVVFFCLGVASFVLGQSIMPLPKSWPKDVPGSIWFDFQHAKWQDYRILLKKVEKYRNVKNPYIQYIVGVYACGLKPDCKYNGYEYLKSAQSNVDASDDLMKQAKKVAQKCGKPTNTKLIIPTTNQYNSKGINFTEVAGVSSRIKGGGFRKVPIGKETYIKDLGKWSSVSYEKLSQDSLVELYLKQNILSRYERTEKGNVIFYKYKNENERLIEDSLDCDKNSTGSDINTTRIKIETDPNNGGTDPNNGGTNPTGAGQGSDPSLFIDTSESIRKRRKHDVNRFDAKRVRDNDSLKENSVNSKGSLSADDNGEWEYGPQNTTGLASGTGGPSSGGGELVAPTAAEIEYVITTHLKFLEALFDTIYTGDQIRVFIEFSPSMLRYNALLRDSLKLPWDIAGYTNHLFNSINVDIFSGSGTFSHELTHLFIKWAYPDAPPWLNEGLACLYEQFDFENALDEKMVISIGKSKWREKYLPEEYTFNETMFQKYKPQLISGILETGNIEFHCVDTLDAKAQAVNYALARRLCSYLQDKNLLKEFISESMNTSIDEKGKSSQYFTDLLLRILNLKNINDLEIELYRYESKELKYKPTAGNSNGRQDQ